MAITYIGTGGASTSNGVDPAPALPTPLQQGDLMLYYFYSREDTDGTLAISAGWTAVINSWGSAGYHRDSGGIMGLWYRLYQSGDTAPTLTLTNFTTGSSGDSIIGEIIAFRGVNQITPIGNQGTVSTNGSQVNIGAISGITLSLDGTVLVLGGKLDDWTSVATLSGDSLTWVEISEQDNAVGLDAGMVWDYAIGATAGSTISSKTFTVTGGLSVPGKGVMFSINEQKDKTRSVSGGVAISSPMFY